MDEKMRREAERNKSVRGYIIRSLVKGYQYAMLQKQLVRVMTDDGIILSPDISGYLQYLQEREYITIVNQEKNSYPLYRGDCVIRLTARGIDLVEDTIRDEGVWV